MAIIIRGKTICKLCNKLILEEQKIVAFPSFITERDDPLMIFSDSAFHAKCFYEHPLASDGIRRLQGFTVNTVSNNRKCWVCMRNIQHPDEYFSFYHLTDKPENFLFTFNYAQFHHSCVKNFAPLPAIIFHLEQILLDAPMEQNTEKIRLLIELKNIIDK